VSSSLILNIAKSGLSAQQTIISNTANNIANVNTEGYTRRRVELQERPSTRTGIALGRGVEALTVRRLGDAFLERVSRDAGAAKEAASSASDLLDRAQAVFDITGDAQTIGSTMEKFFGAIGDLTTDPSNSGLRSNVIEQGNLLTATINRSFNQIAELQTEADARIANDVDTINGLLDEIARLNTRVSEIEGGDVEASSERDQREIALSKLSEIVQVNTVEDSSGQVTVSLSNGFALVNGSTVRKISVTKNPSFIVPPAVPPPSLSGGPMNYIVYDYDPGAGTQHLDLTGMISQRDGRLGGLLRTRGVHASNANTSPFQATGDLVEVASRIEAITRVLLTEFNQVYLGVSQANLASSVGNPLANDENPVGSPASYSPTSGYFDKTTGASVPAGMFGFFDYTGAADALTGTVTGLPDNGDLNSAAATLFSFAQRIKVAIANPDQIAHGRDLNPAEGALEIMPGDTANLAELVKMRSQVFNMTVGGYTMNSTLSDAYSDAVTDISSKVQTAKGNYNVANSSKLSADSQKAAMSGVSLDEEFSDLIRFQRAFQASARMISVADEMLQDIMGLV
jgi:flagellar hook-associated protein 1 FlgK